MKLLVAKEKQPKLSNMFMRLQEFYESPEFRGRIFTRKEFLDWYSKTRTTKYHNDWAGFNIPGWVIEMFRHGTFDPLTKQEKELLNRCGTTTGSFYVIGVEEDGSAMDHEKAHALYYMNQDYKKEADAITSAMCPHHIRYWNKFLTNSGYHKNVVKDEIQAYLISDKNCSRSVEAREQMLSIFHKFCVLLTTEEI